MIIDGKDMNGRDTTSLKVFGWPHEAGNRPHRTLPNTSVHASCIFPLGRETRFRNAVHGFLKCTRRFDCQHASLCSVQNGCSFP